METEFRFSIRPAKAGDIPYIVATWLKSARDSALVRGMDDADYWPFMRSLCVRLLADSRTIARVAAAPDDADTILGWSAATDTSLHWVYVRRDFRGNGIARALVPEVGSYSLRPAKLGRTWRTWKYRPSELCIWDA